MKAVEYALGSKPELLPRLVWGLPSVIFDPNVYYPTVNQPDHDEEIDEAAFMGFPVEEVDVFDAEEGEFATVVKKNLIIAPGGLAYELFND